MKNNWQNTKIGEYFDVTNGKTNSDDAVVNGQYPLFDRSVLIKKSNKYLFDKEALIIPGEGKEFLPRYFLGKFDLHQRAYAIFSKENSDVNIKYLYHWMNYRKDYLIQNAVGSTVKSLRLYMLNDFPLVVPSIQVQLKITAILSTIDDAVQKTEQIIEKTEVLKKGMMSKLLDNNTKAWKEYALDEICNFTTGKLNSNMAIQNGKYPFFTCAQETFAIDSFSFDTKAVLLAGNNAAGIYSVKYYDGKFDAYQRTYVITVKDMNTLDYYFLKELLNIRLNMLKDYSVGTNTKFLTLKLLLGIRVPLPPIEVQRKTSEALKNVDLKLSLEKHQKSQLIKLKISLMNYIFSRKVEVKNAT
jgi:restriction endonuclease S subunit